MVHLNVKTRINGDFHLNQNTSTQTHRMLPSFKYKNALRQLFKHNHYFLATGNVCRIKALDIFSLCSQHATDLLWL